MAENKDKQAAAVSNGPEAETSPAADTKNGDQGPVVSDQGKEKAAPATTAAADKSAAGKANDEGNTKGKVRRVRVITKGPLGPKLLAPGTITSDPDYVGILDMPYGDKKVELVK